MRKHYKTIIQEFKSTIQKDIEYNERLLETVTETVPGNSSNRITAFTNIFSIEHSEKAIYQQMLLKS